MHLIQNPPTVIWITNTPLFLNKPDPDGFRLLHYIFRVTSLHFTNYLSAFFINHQKKHLNTHKAPGMIRDPKVKKTHCIKYKSNNSERDRKTNMDASASIIGSMLDTAKRDLLYTAASDDWYRVTVRIGTTGVETLFAYHLSASKDKKTIDYRDELWTNKEWNIISGICGS